VAVLVPVKAFHQAKLRLAPTLDAAARAALAERMATTVLAAAAPLPVWVVCDDEAVAAWATAAGAGVSWQPGRGLDEAVGAAVAEQAAAGFGRVIVAHGDLPLARELSWLADTATPDEVVLVPDRRDDGTNVACLPSAAGFRFAYGAGSFDRHRAEATRLGLALRVVRDAALGWDVDVPDDLTGVPDL
jgi:2-phospho-L-lactate guanylyltransferase